jgi:hypothetical protein
MSAIFRPLRFESFAWCFEHSVGVPINIEVGSQQPRFSLSFKRIVTVLRFEVETCAQGRELSADLARGC